MRAKGRSSRVAQSDFSNQIQVRAGAAETKVFAKIKSEARLKLVDFGGRILGSERFERRATIWIIRAHNDDILAELGRWTGRQIKESAVNGEIAIDRKAAGAAAAVGHRRAAGDR